MSVKTMTLTALPAALFVTAAMLVACADKPAAGPAAAIAPTVAPATAPLALPISLNALMVGAIDHASDPLFAVGNGQVPKDDDGWREVEYNAYQMIGAGKLIQLAGTGPKDAEWVANADWKRQSEDLTQVGMDLLKLAQSRDIAGFEAAGNRLVAVCEDCHRQFKPELPTMGILHKPTFPPPQPK